MISTTHAVLAILAMAAVTIALRALPFFAAGALRDRPSIADLGRFLPPAIMTLLVLHAIVSGVGAEGGLPWRATVSTLVVIVLQLVWRRPLPSIAGGTAVYMILLQLAHGA